MSYTVTVNPPITCIVTNKNTWPPTHHTDFPGKPGMRNLSLRTAEVEENLPSLAAYERVNHFETTQYGQTEEGYSLTMVSWVPVRTTF